MGVRLFSVDVEDWYHSNFQSAPSLDGTGLERRVEYGVARVLETLALTGSIATFFVLGVVASEYPHLVRRIADAGHEIGCHSWDHTLVYEQTPDQALAALKRARALLEDQSGQRVRGFRAPSWSITEQNLWALDVILAAGFEYDSSIFPAVTHLYGIADAPGFPYRVRTPEGVLLEIPPSTLRIGRRRIGVGGGVYLRALPLALHRYVLRRCLAKNRPFISYIHPRELDPESWNLKIPLSLYEGTIHRIGLEAGERRIRTLLQDGPWRPFAHLVEQATTELT
jgi:polysaccharide deacetylase family protein (PEP-CTERM system associated)